MALSQKKILYHFTLAFLTLVVSLYTHPFLQAASESKNQSKQFDDADWKTRLEYARVLMYQKRYEEASAQFNKILQEQPDLTEVKIDIAKLQYYQNNFENALKILEEISDNERTQEIELLEADIYLGKKNYPRAEELYKKNLDYDPENKDNLLLKLAQMYSWQKRYPESLELYQQLILRHPDDIQLKRHYGQVLSWAGKHSEAAAVLKETLDK